MKAIAQIIKVDNEKIIGYIFISEEDDHVQIRGDIKNLTPNKKLAMHIHEKGDPTQCCGKLGSHYNPFNQNHGDRTSKIRHVGDLGNIQCDNNGHSSFSFSDDLIKLSGPYSIIGRSFVIHENEDDLGLTNHPESKTTGNSGKRIAYGIIGFA